MTDAKKVLVLSDLHLDIWTRHRSDAMSFIASKVPQEFRSPDVLIHSGDLAHAKPLGWEGAIDLLKEAFPDTPEIYLIPGNHDYYLGEFDDQPLREAAERKGCVFGQKKQIFVNDTRILMCTLWTDFALMGEDDIPRTARAVQAGLNDYRVIAKKGENRAITAIDTEAAHQDHSAWLKEMMSVPHDGPTMVITHHGPHPDASLPVDEITAGFVSDLSGLMERGKPDLWLFGHTHRPQEAVIHQTHVLNVGIGYPNELRMSIDEIISRGCVEIGERLVIRRTDVKEIPENTL